MFFSGNRNKYDTINIPAKAAPHLTPRIVETKASSKIVGTTLNTIAVRTKLIPRDPRSIVFDKAPKVQLYNT